MYKEKKMSGKEIRLGKMFSRGKAVVVAADHGAYMGPFKGIDELPKQIYAFKKADGFLVMPGMAKLCKDFFAQKESPLCIVRVNYATHYIKAYEYTKGYNERFISIKQAVALGADMVIVSLLFSGNDEANTRNVMQFGEYVEEANELGIPLVGEYIPIRSVDRFNEDPEKLLLGTRAVAEFGADLIKTVYIEEKFEEIVKTSMIPVLALGGAKTDKSIDSFRVAHHAVQKGASGVVFGRNVICAERPKEYLDILIDIVKHGMSPEEADKKYNI